MNHSNYITNPISSYSHLTLNERQIIHRYYHADKSFQFIADKLGRSKSTIHYEITHNGSLKLDMRKGCKRAYKYYAKTAHNRALDKLRINKISESNKMFQKEFLSLSKEHPTYSIEALYNLISSNSKPSLRTFYDWLYMGLISCNQYKRKRNKSSSTFNDSLGRKNINQREMDFGFKQDDYSNVGHYEIDTVIDGAKKGGLLTFNHRATMRLYSRYIHDKKASTVNKALRSIINQIGSHNILSITSDNGTEFSYSLVIENCYDLKWYYCDPYRSGQRGQNERLNRNLRTFFPKGTIFKRVTDKMLEHALNEINNMPRRKFGGISSINYSFRLTSKNQISL